MWPFEDVTGALISLLIGGLLGRELYRIVDKPSVTIQYRQPVVFQQSDGQFLSIRVGNVGRNAAEKCMCTLSIFGESQSRILSPSEAEAQENLHEYKDEKLDLEYPRYQLIQPDSQRTIANDQLCWSALGNPAQVEINPGTTQAIDLCKYFNSKGKEYYIFPSEFGWRRVRTRMQADKPLRCRVLVCPANDYPTPLDFELFVDSGNVRIKKVRLTLLERLRRLLLRRSIYTKQI